MRTIVEKTKPNAQDILGLLERMEYLLTNDFAAALELSTQLIDLAENQPDLISRAKAYTFVGIAYFRGAHFEQAKNIYEQGVALARSLKETSLEARCLNGLGLVYYQLGEYNTAIQYQLENLKIVQENADHEGRIRALINIGVLHDQLEQAEKALDYHQEALALAKTQGLLRYECICAINVAGYYHDKKEFDTAIRLYQITLTKIQASSERALEGSLLLNLAKAYLEAEDFSNAHTISQQALPTTQASGDRENECETFIVRGRIELKLGQHEAANYHFISALNLAQEIEVKRHIFNSHRYLSESYEEQGNYPQALTHARMFHKLEREVHSEEVARKTQFLTTKAEAERFKHEAEIERLRNVELALLNRELEDVREKLVFQAEHDSLTGLPNRSVFEQRLQRATLIADGNKQQFAVLFIDLDKFKMVNDSLGHDVGDELLIHVAARLKNCVRRGDLIARMGGDEFTVLIENIISEDLIYKIAQKILSVLNSPYELLHKELHITASIGIAIYPQDGMDAMTLKKSADIAMYHVKYQGKNGYKRYDPSLEQRVLANP